MAVSRGKRKIIMIILLIFLVICILISGVLAWAFIKGKPLKISPSIELDVENREIQEILWYSSLSPNSHNAQSWKVKVDNEKINISLDESRLLNVVDSKKREAYISLGCYVENMRLAFDSFGYDTQVEYLQEAVSVEYSKREHANIDKSNIGLICKRHTDKSAYKNKKLDSNDVKKLNENNNQVKIYSQGEEKFNYVKDLSFTAMQKQTDNQEYRDELAKWMRFSDSEAEEKLDGITAEMIGLTRIKKTLYYLTTSYDSAKGDRFAKQGIDTAKKQLNNCGAFAIFESGNSFAELIDTGRALQSFWLECTKIDIAVQPFSSAVEEDEIRKKIEEKIDTETNVQLILRLGYVKDYGENFGYRRNLKDYVVVL